MSIKALQLPRRSKGRFGVLLSQRLNCRQFRHVFRRATELNR